MRLPRQRRIACLLVALLLAASAPCAAVAALPAKEGVTAVWAYVERFNAFVPEGDNPSLRGSIRSKTPIARVEAMLTDELLLETTEYVWEPEPEEQRTSFSLDLIRRNLLGWNHPGEYRLTIWAETDGQIFTVFDREFYRAGDCPAPKNLNALCVFESSAANTRLWSDNDARTGWAPAGAEDALVIILPERGGAEGLQVWWSEPPEAASFVCRDAQGSALSTEVRGDGFTPLIDWVPIPAGARTVTLSVTGCGVEELLVIGEGDVPAAVQFWEKTSPKWDMMVVSTHQDDEHIFFGASIPTALGEGREVGVVYMVTCSERRLKEALTGLWSVGMRNYPVFLGLADGMPEDGTTKKWGGEEYYVGLLVEQIRRYRPEVVLTHDFRGEYGHKQHIATANAVAAAVAAAADPEQYPESATLYGVWQAKKLYIHLWKENVLALDWSQPLPGFGGMTGYDVSRRAYDKHRSQQQFVPYSMGIGYDNSIFGLYFSTVGPDEEGSGFFEHID